jgi:hypothetical protein
MQPSPNLKFHKPGMAPIVAMPAVSFAARKEKLFSTGM